MANFPRKRRLHSLKVTEISLVDRPANQHSHIELAKRDGLVPGVARGQALVDLARQRGASAIAKAAPSSADTMAAGRTRALAILKAAGANRDGVVPLQAQVVITKLGAEDQRYIAGWASVVAVNGEVVVDRQGDTISEADLVQAAHNFIAGERQGLVMHKGAVALTIVESVVMRPEVAKAMGVATDTTGWWIGAKVHDADAWARVKSGELRSLSIAGRALWEEA